MTSKLHGDKLELSPEFIERVDCGIQDLVKELNLKGYHTTMSCAGHRSPSSTDTLRGVVSFTEHWDVNGIADILEKHHLSNIRIGYSKYDPRDVPVYLLATFDPVGIQREVFNPIERKDMIRASKSLIYDPLDEAEYEAPPDIDEY